MRNAYVVALLIVVLSPAVSIGDVVPIGDQMLVNTYTAGDQGSNGRLDMVGTANGNFLVVWTSIPPDLPPGFPKNLNVFGQQFTSSGTRLGAEFQVNSNTGHYAGGYRVAASASATGDFVVVWTAVYDGFVISGQRFDSSGQPQGDQFQVNSYTNGYSPLSGTYGLDVAAGGGGNFVVAWNSKDQDGESFGVFAQRFGSDGSRLGSEFQVNSYTGGDEGRRVEVAADGEDDFVVVWTTRFGLGGNDYNVFGQRFASNGTRLGAEFQVNTYTDSNAGQATYSGLGISSMPSGEFVIVWYAQRSHYVMGQRFSSTGARSGAEFQVNTQTDAPARYGPEIAHDANGNFVVSWSGYLPGPPYTDAVFARAFDSAGMPMGGAFQVNSQSVGYLEPYSAPVAASDGLFIVSWSAPSDPDGDIWARRFGFCGNGTVDVGEQCDDAVDNGSSSSCCTAECLFKPNGNASCDGNACTRPDTCANGVCTPGSCADGSACTICGGTCDDSGGSCVCL